LFIDLLEIKSNTLFKSSIPLFARGISFNINEIFSKLKDLFFNKLSSLEIETYLNFSLISSITESSPILSSLSIIEINSFKLFSRPM
jgi:hypothetical protein